MSKHWVFERTPEMGGATGGAFTNTLLGAGMAPAAVLAREAIQNSVDARYELQKVRVNFRRETLTGKAKAEFIATLELDPALTSHRASLKLPLGACLDSLDKKNVPLHLLFVEDYGTCGLHGNPTSSKSHFFRLLMSLGDDTKASEAEGSGGSYGFGKSVYSSNSRIHTIVAYSAFNPALSGVTPQNHARLMGCSYFNQHEYRKEEFSGRAWFGRPTKGGGAAPFLDSSADELAARLGFKKRAPNEYGTSLMIVDCDVDCDMLRESIEEWWWPRLLDGETGLDISLAEQGKILSPPRPRKRADLRPFIECFDLAIGRSVPTPPQQKAGPFNKLHEKDLGNFAYAVLSDDAESDERLREKIGRIALIRKPRMVIEYMTVGGTLPMPCIGTFVASADIDNALKRSEPATHDRWDPKSARLGELEPEAREAVGTVLQRLRGGLRRFANETMPETPKQELRLKVLEKLLGNLFRPPTTGGGGTGGSPSDPITINFVQEPAVVTSGASIRSEGSFRLGLADGADRESVKVSVRVSCLIQEDDGVSKEDPIEVKLQSNDVVNLDTTSSSDLITFQLCRNQFPVFNFKTEPYARDWTTHVQVHVEEV
jgi:hypothetical protein